MGIELEKFLGGENGIEGLMMTPGKETGHLMSR